MQAVGESSFLSLALTTEAVSVHRKKLYIKKESLV